MIKKRGLIAHHGEIKMNKVRAKTSDRQAKIKQCLESISFMDIKSELLGLSQLLNDIGLANPSELEGISGFPFSTTPLRIRCYS